MDKGRILADSHNLLVNVAGGTTMTLNEVQILMEELGRHVGDATRILFGTAVDARLGDRMCVTLISSVSLAPAVEKPAPARATWSEPPKPRETKPPIAPFEKPAKAKHAPAKREEEEEPLLQNDDKEPREEEAPVARPRPVAVRIKAPVLDQPPAAPQPVASALAKPPQERQETLPFEPLNRGRFEKSEPTIVNGQDLDVPTFMRKNIKIK